MKHLILLTLFSLVLVPSLASAECRQFSRSIGTQSITDFRALCLRQVPRGHHIQSLGRKVTMDGPIHSCTICRDEVAVARPLAAVEDDGCQTFSRVMNSAIDFRNLCRQSLPNGYRINNVGTRVRNAEIERYCKMCPEGDTRSRRVDDSDRRIPRGDTTPSCGRDCDRRASPRGASDG